MTITEADWSRARRTVRRAVRTSLHCGIASTDPDGSPHVTPIGSVLLGDIGSALYFDVFNRRLAANIAGDARVTILAVDSGRWMWARSLLAGTFVAPPGIRLTGTVGPARPSTPEEVRHLQRRLGPLLRTPGGRKLWGSLPRVRDVTVDSVDLLSIGAMTRK